MNHYETHVLYTLPTYYACHWLITPPPPPHRHVCCHVGVQLIRDQVAIMIYLLVHCRACHIAGNSITMTILHKQKILCYGGHA